MGHESISTVFQWISCSHNIQICKSNFFLAFFLAKKWQRVLCSISAPLMMRRDEVLQTHHIVFCGKYGHSWPLSGQIGAIPIVTWGRRGTVLHGVLSKKLCVPPCTGPKRVNFVLLVCVPVKTERTSSTPLKVVVTPTNSPKLSTIDAEQSLSK